MEVVVLDIIFGFPLYTHVKVSSDLKKKNWQNNYKMKL